MTIKKRLFISNLLMMVVPIVIYLITVAAAIFTLSILYDIELGGGRGAGYRAEILAAGGVSVVFFAIAVFTLLVVIVIITNRLLTKFVFKRIMQPLEMLSDGVRHISDGDLDYRLNYSAKDEFAPICAAFNDMAAKLKIADEIVQKSEQNRKELFSSISHDLRSPLTSIKAFAEGLVDGVAQTPEAQQEYLQVIIQKADDVNSMVSQLFLYSKMDMGNYPNNPEILDVGKEIEEFIAASSEEYKAKGLLIKVVGTTTEVCINADPLQLRSVFANILDNSAKYKHKDSAIAKITALAEDEFIKIIFEDNGVGVKDEMLPKLFDAFYRADPSRNNPQQGSGLGLAIARKAIERMGGNISAENCKKSGLRIIIKIPIVKGVQGK